MKKLKRILAIVAIVLLLSMYLINLVLALIGSDWAQQMLKLTMVLSIMIPILLYAFLMLMRRNDRFPTSPEFPGEPGDGPEEPEEDPEEADEPMDESDEPGNGADGE